MIFQIEKTVKTYGTIKIGHTVTDLTFCMDCGYLTLNGADFDKWHCSFYDNKELYMAKYSDGLHYSVRCYECIRSGKEIK